MSKLFPPTSVYFSLLIWKCFPTSWITCFCPLITHPLPSEPCRYHATGEGTTHAGKYVVNTQIAGISEQGPSCFPNSLNNL